VLLLQVFLNFNLKKNFFLKDESHSSLLNTSQQHSQSLEAAEEIQIDYSDLRSFVKKVFFNK
jgi:hypothetical protein